MGFTRDYFSFSQREKRGIIILLVIISILIIFRNLDLFLDKNEIKNNKELFEEIVSFEKSLKKMPKIEKKFFLFDFDPNTTTKEEFAKLGLKSKQIKVIENYRNKGGKFFKKEDFKKIYSISDNLYKKLENYIKIERKFFSKKTPKIEKKFFLFDFDPNKATKEEFTKLGITEKQIKVIENYRNKGGKFFEKEDFKKIYSISDNLYKKLENYIKIERKIFSKKTPKIEKKFFLFDFDPNTTTKEEFTKLGMTEKQIKVIENYRNKGGSFFEKEDFKKIYSISDSLYKKLENYIKINFDKNEKLEKIVIEINNSNIDDLQKINGINEFLAKRIIKFRKLIGGFVDKNQLMEVYGLKKENFERIKNNIKIDKSKIKKININFDDIKELSKHYYLTYFDAKNIVEFRTKHGSFKKIDDILEKKILPKEIFDKIKDYLTL